MTTLVDRIDKLVASNRATSPTASRNAKELSAKLQTTVDNMNAITGRIAEGQGTVGKLVQSDETEQEPERGARRGQGRRRRASAAR